MAMTRALVVMAMLHYIWRSYGNSFHAAMVTNTNLQPDFLGGITSTENGSAKTGPTAGCELAAAMTP